MNNPLAKASFGSSYRYSVDGLIGASPELLVLVDGDVVRSHPLAGTAPRTGDADNDRLAASPNRRRLATPTREGTSATTVLAPHSRAEAAAAIRRSDAATRSVAPVSSNHRGPNAPAEHRRAGSDAGTE